MDKLKANYKVELVVKGRGHYYDVSREGMDTVRYGGVTGMLSIINKPALVLWAKREALASVESELKRRMKDKEKSRITITQQWINEMLEAAKKKPDQIRDDAADTGTRIHDLVDKIIKGEKFTPIPADLLAPIGAFRKWWETSGVEFVMGDTPVASIKYGFGGKLDALGRRGNKYVILDWKSGKAIYPEAALQVGAYAQALYETYGITPDDATVVRFGKEIPIEFEHKSLSDIRRSLSGFLNAKSLKQNLAQDHFAGF